MNQKMKIHPGFCIQHSINNKVEQVNHNLGEANLLALGIFPEAYRFLSRL